MSPTPFTFTDNYEIYSHHSRMAVAANQSPKQYFVTLELSLATAGSFLSVNRPLLTHHLCDQGLGTLMEVDLTGMELKVGVGRGMWTEW